MKFTGFAIAIAFVLSGCFTEPPATTERMVIDPHTLSFSKPDTTQYVSITHTCTCPFSWQSKVVPASPWLFFPADTVGDHASIAVTIERSLMTTDTGRATVVITSNSYGIDSIQIVAIRKPS